MSTPPRTPGAPGHVRKAADFMEKVVLSPNARVRAMNQDAFRHYVDTVAPQPALEPNAENMVAPPVDGVVLAAPEAVELELGVENLDVPEEPPVAEVGAVLAAVEEPPVVVTAEPELEENEPDLLAEPDVAQPQDPLHEVQPQPVETFASPSNKRKARTSAGTPAGTHAMTTRSANKKPKEDEE
jgi:hypothetical protein